MMSLLLTDQSFSIDVFNFDTYHLVSPANSSELNLYVDGSLITTITAATSSLNGFGFGDGLSPPRNGANVDWDYILISQVPVPPAVWHFGSGLIGLIGLARRKKA